MTLLKAVKDGNFDYVINNYDKNPYLNQEWADYDLLNTALQFNRREIAKFLIEKKCTINKQLSGQLNHDTPLHRAINLKNIDLIELLLENGASIHVKNNKGDTPLHLAAKKLKKSDMSIFMIDIQASKALNLSDQFGLTYVHIYCMLGHTTIVGKFLENGVEVNGAVRDNSPYCPGFTLLHFAVANNHNWLSEFLLNKGADVNIIDSKKMTPLHVAFTRKNKYLVNLILQRQQIIPNLSDHRNISHFHVACTGNHIHILERMLQDGYDINSSIKSNASSLAGYTPLHIAVTYDSEASVKFLLEHNADFLAEESLGFTPLHLAFWKKNYEIIDLILSYHHKKLENPFDHRGVTHFHIICMRNFPSLLKNFIEIGIDVNAPIKLASESLSGFTPLHIAVKFEQVANVQVLLENKANVNAQEKYGATPLHLVCQGTFMDLKKLEQWPYTRDPRQTMLKWFQSMHESVLLADLLFKYSIDVEIQDKKGCIPLFHLYDGKIHGLLDRLFYSLRNLPANVIQSFTLTTTNEISLFRKFMLQKILSKSIDLSVTDKSGNNILHMSADISKYLLQGEETFTSLYILKGADVNGLNKKHQSPLHIAVSNNCMNIVEVLLQHNADPNIPELGTLQTPLHKAISYLTMSWRPENKKILSKLIQHKADVNAKKSDGKTAIHLIFQGSYFVRNFDYIELYTSLCDIDARDFSGQTALHCATKATSINIDGIKWLLDCGANIDIKDNKGKTPLMYAIQIMNQPSIFHLYLNHMKKMQIIGYQFCAENTSCAARLQSSINDFLDLKEEQCLDELERMKAIKIDNYTSLYNILFKSANKMTRYCKNKQLCETLTCKSFKKEFPFYRFLLKLQVGRGILRLPLLEPAKDAMRVLINFKFPEICYESILTHMKDKDLENLISAKTIVLEEREKIQVEMPRKRIVDLKKRQRYR